MTFAMPHDATEHRRHMCRIISEKLRAIGYDVSPQRVNRNYIVMRRWHDGYLALGYLIRQTGIKRLPER